MRKLLSIGGALLALAAFASTADARMGGGGGMSMSPSTSHGGGHTSTSSSMGSPRGSNIDVRSSTIGGRTSSAGDLRTRVKGTHWKHPIDSDNGGPDDPPKKTPMGSSGEGRTQWTSNGGGWEHRPPSHQGTGGWDGLWSSGDSYRTQPAPASRTPR